MPLWCRETPLLKSTVEKLARTAFQRNKDPMDAAVWFAILRKEKVLAGLFKSVSNTKMADFFSNDFKTDRWRQAALKNAFALLGKRRYFDAIAFFLIGGALKDALDVARSRIGDVQLALLIAKLYAGDAEFLSIVESMTEDDPFICSIHHWLNGEYISAVDVLIDSASDKYDTAKVFTFYRFLSRNPLYLKAKSIQSCPVGHNHAKREHDLFLRAAVSHLVAGCPIPALIVLQEVPKVHISPRVKSEVAPVKPHVAHDWSQPETNMQDELQLDWSDDDDSADSDDHKDIEEPPSLAESTNADSGEEDPDDAARFLTSKALDCYFLQTFSFKKNISSLESVSYVIASLKLNMEEYNQICHTEYSGKSWIHYLRTHLLEQHSVYQLALSLYDGENFMRCMTVPIVTFFRF